MQVEDMIYEFKAQLNALDSNKYRGLQIPEIDWALNRAQALLVTSISNPRMFVGTAFDLTQRSIDDLRTIVKEIEITPTVDGDNYIVSLPSDYLHYILSYSDCLKGVCSRRIRNYKVQANNLHEESPFSQSSFEWEEINSRLVKDGLKLYTDGSFSIYNVVFEYIGKPAYIHDAKDFEDGTYVLPSGVTLTGKQDCELPESIHRTLVTLAVLLTTGDINPQEYDIKLQNFRLNYN